MGKLTSFPFPSCLLNPVRIAKVFCLSSWISIFCDVYRVFSAFFERKASKTLEPKMLFHSTQALLAAILQKELNNFQPAWVRTPSHFHLSLLSSLSPHIFLVAPLPCPAPPPTQPMPWAACASSWTSTTRCCTARTCKITSRRRGTAARPSSMPSPCTRRSTSSS